MQIERNKFQSIQLFYRIFIFGLMLFILDYLVGSGLSWIYKIQKNGVFYHTTYGLERTVANILIFGSSSANHHYIPEIISNQLKMSVYNQGHDGINILYQWALLKGILKRYKPKIILLNLTPNELSLQDNYDSLSVLSPYYKKHTEMRDIINLRSKFEPIKHLSAIYPYNSTILTMLPNLISKKGVRSTNGYYPIYGSAKKMKIKMRNFKNNTNLDPFLIEALDNFMKKCKQDDIALYLVFSPWFSFEIFETATIIKVNELALKYKVPVYNFIKDPEFNGQDDIYQDSGHLNHSGALMFSKRIAKEISISLRN